MRRPNRNIEIFSMSVLDMFASALGAFILISVILFPYFNQAQQLDQQKQKLETVTKDLGQAREKIRHDEQASDPQQEGSAKAIQVKTQVEECKKGMALCRVEQSRPFLVVVIEWTERCDVDLYVKDPYGNQFYYGHANRSGEDFPGTEAQLSLDMRDGPGTEMWVNPKAEPGLYEVSYRLAGTPTNPSPRPSITGYVIDRDGGLRPLPTKTVGSSQTVSVATMQVSANGSVAIAAAQDR
jgi:hypothetical protein